MKLKLFAGSIFLLAAFEFAGFATPAADAAETKSALVAKVRAHARAAGVPPKTAVAVVRQESGFRPDATGRAGEIGLMQLKCRTARSVGFRGHCRALYDPETNLRYGMRYLRKALKRGSVAYYNAGIHAKRLPKTALAYADKVNTRIGGS